MKLVQSILTNNPCYKAGRKITVKGLMLHSVGCPQPKASVFINSWNKSDYGKACVHGFIDGNDGTVYQTLPWNHRGWHAGSRANNTHIGVEMCEPACIKYTTGSSFVVTSGKEAEAKAVTERTYQSAVELFAMLCKEYGLNPLGDGVIISHREGYKRGVASNHGDPEHLWKGLGLEYTMDGFRKDVIKAMEGEVTKPGTGDSDALKGISEDGMNNSDCPFKVKVTIPNLNIRKGAGTNTAKTGKYTGVGVFTIMEVKSGIGSDEGWGRLKSGAGWISLDYCKLYK